MPPGSIVSDVGSAKAEIVRGLRSLPNGVAFIGAHPLAGSERRGIGAARADLFEGSVCVLTPDRRTDKAALSRVRSLWSDLAGRVVTMAPEAHDRLLAATSHLAHWLAFCLVEATEPRAREIAPRSFLDATRVAMSDPDLWDDIFLTNRAALLRAMDRFELRWRSARRLLMRGDRAALVRFLRHAQSLRQRLG
jgi:prephenate dehydrogenase